MSSPQILIVMGVSGSGKTEIGKRLASALNWQFFDADDFHSPENIQKMQQSIPLTDADREEWLQTLQDLIRDQLKAHCSSVLACSALKQSYRDQLNLGSEVEFVYLKGSYELILHRLKSRADHYMPSDLLDSQFDALEEPSQALEIDASQSPDCIIQTIQDRLFDASPKEA
jgi:gluconokinase